MINTLVRWTGLFILIYILQTTLVPVISVFGVQPDLLIVPLFFLCVRIGGVPAVFTGFLLGLTQDFYSPQILGQNALAKSIIAYFAGLFNEKVMRLDPFIQLVLLFTTFLLHDVVYLAVEVVQNGESLQSAGTRIVTMTLPRALYSLFFALIPTFRELLFTSDNRR
jgi:rod shape-determining protein MreD